MRRTPGAKHHGFMSLSAQGALRSTKLSLKRQDEVFQCIGSPILSCPCPAGSKLFLGLQPGSRADTPPEEGFSRRHFGQRAKSFLATVFRQAGFSVLLHLKVQNTTQHALTQFDYPGKVCFTVLSGIIHQPVGLLQRCGGRVGDEPVGTQGSGFCQDSTK